MKHLKTIFAIFIFACIASCSSDDAEPTTDSQTEGSNNSNKVFVVGLEAKGNFTVPVLWTNGTKSYLPTVAETDVDDLKIAVENNDVYVVAVERNSNNKSSIVLWKNGVQSRFTQPAKQVTIEQLIVDNGNVYVLGREYFDDLKEKYKYWKNGVATTIMDSSVEVSDDYEENRMTKMVVANNDVYCIGAEWDSTGKTLTAKYWKNAVPTNITVFKDDIFDNVKDIQVNGTDISILYNQFSSSTFLEETKLWKNNEVSVIASGNNDFYASALIIKDGIEHIVVEEEITSTKTKVLYFKNRVKTEITDGNSNVTASYLGVNGSNVCIAYIADLVFNYSNKYWLNGTTKTLNGYDREPFDVFFMAGADVYMTCQYNTAPSFWKNGTQMSLPFESSNNYAAAFDVFVTQ